jgi:hypothetical protein
MFRRASWTVAVAVAAYLASTAAPASAAVSRKCTAGELQGRYGFLTTGHVVENDADVPYAAGGVLTLNRDGTFSLEGSQTQDGVVGPVTPNVGTWQVRPNCTGSATTANGPLFNFVVVGDAGKLELIRTDLGVIVTGFAKRVAKECTLLNVRGGYGYAFNAIVYNLPIQNMLLSRAFFSGGGVVEVSVTPDGEGKAVLDDTASFGGIVIPRHYEGTVEVGADCTGSAVVTLPPNAPTSTNPVHVNAIWVEDRGSVILIQTDPGTFIAGEATMLQHLRKVKIR